MRETQEENSATGMAVITCLIYGKMTSHANQITTFTVIKL